MKQGRTILAVLLLLALLASMSVCALAEGTDGEVLVEEEGGKMAVKCVDAAGKTLRESPEDALDLSKDLVVDEKYARPEIEGYTYEKTMVGEEEIQKLTVTHNDGGAVITVTVGQGDEAKEKTLTGSETLLFVYAKKEAEHVHVYDEGKVTKEPTCTEPGVKTYTCSCGDTRTEEIPALGHDWDEGKVTKEPSCTEKGEKTFTCKRDANHTRIEELAALDHDWDEGKVTKEPTCTEKGEKTFTCKRDANHTKTEELAALGHDFAHGRCKRCDAIDPNFKPKLTDGTNGHASWGTDYKVSSDAARKDFQKVLIDGSELASSDYSVSEKDGNTVVTVKGEAIKKLKVGQHKIAVVSVTGTAERSFSVSDKPKTGDGSLALWTGLLTLSALGCGALLTARKRFDSV